MSTPPARRRPGHRRKPRSIVLTDRTVLSHGLPTAFWQDLYFQFMRVGWGRVFAGLAAFFLGFNLLFALAYWVEPDCITNVDPPGFWGFFFFSVETLATVGYGDMHPRTAYGHIVGSIEIFTGLIFIALMTGAMFARFSRPRARILFSRQGVVRPIDGRATLMFRTANARQNIIMEASAQLRMLRDVVTAEGFRLRRITDLPLARRQTPVFLLGWILMHIIDEASPLFGESSRTLAEAHATFLLTMSGMDETTGQVVTARHEYRASDVLWNHRFRDMLHTDAQGVEHLEYAHFDVVEPLPDAALEAAGEEP